MAFNLRSCALPFLAVVLSVILQGCGGGGGGSTTTPAPTPTPTPAPAPATTVTTTTVTTITSTTSTTHAPVDPIPWQDALQELNDLYTGWDPANKSTRYGVTVRWLHSVHILNDHHWYYCQDKCDKGFADCRVSASLLNNQTMIGNQVPFNMSLPAHVEGFAQTLVGVAFNQSFVEDEAGKCYYQFDGATTYRYNHGCGCGADQAAWVCTSNESPYANIDPKTGQQMNSKSDKVAGCHCGDGKLVPNPPPSKTTDSQCYWKGPAFDSSAEPVNELSNMMEQRMKNQHGFDVVQDEKRSRLAYTNEVVIDGNLLSRQLADDPSKAILGIIYVMNGDHGDQDAHDYAHKLATYFEKEYIFSKAPPVFAMDTRADVRERGPFVPHAAGLKEDTVIA